MIMSVHIYRSLFCGLRHKIVRIEADTQSFIANILFYFSMNFAGNDLFIKACKTFRYGRWMNSDDVEIFYYIRTMCNIFHVALVCI